MHYGVPMRTAIRLFSLGTLGLDFLQLLIGLYIYVYVRDQFYGAWWAAPPAILSGLLGVVALNRGYIVTSPVMAAFRMLCSIPAIVCYDFSSATSCGYNSFISEEEEEEDELEDNVDEYWKNLKRVSDNCAELILGEIDLVDWFNDIAVSFVAPFRKSDYCKQRKETSEIMNSSHAHRIAGFKFTN